MKEIIDKVVEMAGTTDGLIVIVVSCLLLMVAATIAKKVLKIVAVSGAIALGVFLVMGYIETGSIDNFEVPDSVKDSMSGITDKLSGIEKSDEGRKLLIQAKAVASRD